MKLKKIDGASIIKMSEKGDYGYVAPVNEKRKTTIEYLAICKYENENEYYLFACDCNFNVCGDSVFESYEEAEKSAVEIYGPVIQWSDIND